MFGAVTCLFLLNYRVTDEIFNFLLVWYYCTLTIRESILRSNGSRIKGWWVSHHYVSTFLSGVMLTWPEGPMYQMFRSQFLAFSIYQSCVQFLQYYYQSGCLYRLRALGERNQLDLTVEGFQSWMWRGLTFLLPFLFFGHFWQLYNAVTLFRLSALDDCKEWQVFMLALTFLVLFLGNFLTTLKVVHQKLLKNKDKVKNNWVSASDWYSKAHKTLSSLQRFEGDVDVSSNSLGESSFRVTSPCVLLCCFCSFSHHLKQRLGSETHWQTSDTVYPICEDCFVPVHGYVYKKSHFYTLCNAAGRL